MKVYQKLTYYAVMKSPNPIYVHTPLLFQTVASCVEGSVRLVVGDIAEEYYVGDYSEKFDDSYYDKNGLLRGRVEVCVGGEFRTVCNNGWSYQDASVVCRQLRLSPYGKINNCIWRISSIYAVECKTFSIGSPLYWY